jgi:hypothetical protein
MFSPRQRNISAERVILRRRESDNQTLTIKAAYPNILVTFFLTVQP